MERGVGDDDNANMYNNQIGYGGVMPLVSGTTTAETLHHHHHHHHHQIPPTATYNSVIVDSVSSAAAAAAAMKSDSGVTYNHNLPLPRKRGRECMMNSPFASSYPPPPTITNSSSKSSGSFSFLGQDISLQIHHQQLEIDRLISQHLEKVRSEVEEKRKRQARRIMEAIEVGVMKRLKAKEEEIEKMGKLNWALEERVKSLCIENQLWRDMAQTNEAAVNALRNNLEQVLCHQVINDDDHDDHHQHRSHHHNHQEEDAESSCGSNAVETEEEEEVEKGEWRRVVKKGGREMKGSRKCRNCGKEESSVLLLPCRHLCMCSGCGSTVNICPICKSTKNATLHLNLSSSSC